MSPILKLDLADIAVSSAEFYLTLLGCDFHSGLKGNLGLATIYLGNSSMTGYII